MQKHMPDLSAFFIHIQYISCSNRRICDCFRILLSQGESAQKQALIILLWIAGIASAGVGLFPETTGIFHTIFSVIVFFSMAFAAIFSYRVTKMPLKIISALLGLFTLSFIFLYIGKIYLGLGAGGAERFIVYPVLFWALAFSGSLMSSE